MLPASVAAQSFKAVAWKTCEVGKGDGGVKCFQPFPALPVKTLERPHELALANPAARCQSRFMDDRGTHSNALWWRSF